MSDTEKRIAMIEQRDPEKPTPGELAAIEAAEKEGYENMISLEEFRKRCGEYNGRLLPRIPRSLHKKLKEEAAAEGVSLNQYMLYKLAQ